MTVNPYEVSAAAADSFAHDAVDVGKPRSLDQLRPAQGHALRVALQTLGVGLAGMLTAVMLYLVVVLPTQFGRDVGLILFAGGTAIVLVGVVLVTRAAGAIQKLSFLAMALQVVSMVGLGGYVVVVRGGMVRSNLIHLFGASVLATLLISLAILALLIRHWSSEERAGRSKVASEIAVLCYAWGAAACSLLSLGFLGSTRDGPLLGTVGVAAGLGVPHLCRLRGLGEAGDPSQSWKVKER